jgi:hypothetical protein
LERNFSRPKGEIFIKFHSRQKVICPLKSLVGAIYNGAKKLALGSDTFRPLDFARQKLTM